MEVAARLDGSRGDEIRRTNRFGLSTPRRGTIVGVNIISIVLADGKHEPDVLFR